MSDQGTSTEQEDRISPADARQAYEPNWYASLLAFSQSVSIVDDPLVVE